MRTQIADPLWITRLDIQTPDWKQVQVQMQLWKSDFAPCAEFLRDSPKCLPASKPMNILHACRKALLASAWSFWDISLPHLRLAQLAACDQPQLQPKGCVQLSLKLETHPHEASGFRPSSPLFYMYYNVSHKKNLKYNIIMWYSIIIFRWQYLQHLKKPMLFVNQLASPPIAGY